MAGLSFFLTTLNGLDVQSACMNTTNLGGTYQCFWSRLISGSSILRPIRRLASKTVFSGFEWKAFFAESPTLKLEVSSWKTQPHDYTYSRSSSVKATHDGVIRWPWSLAMISTRPPVWTLNDDETRQPWSNEAYLRYTWVTDVLLKWSEKKKIDNGLWVENLRCSKICVQKH